MNKKPTYEELERELKELKNAAESQAIPNIADVMFVALDKDGFVTIVNQKTCQVLECEKKDVIGKSWIDVFIPEHERIKLLSVSEKSLPDNSELIGDYKSSILTINGDEKQIYWHNSTIRDDEGNIIGYYGSGIDIIGQEKSELKIRKLSSAVEQSSNAILITDIDGNIEYTNPKFSELTGYSAKESLGQNPRFLNSGEQSKEYYLKMWKNLASGNTWEGEFCNKSKNGKLYWEYNFISPIKDETGKTISYLAIKEDITSKKEAKRKLRENTQQIEVINANTPNIIWKIEIDKKGNYTNSYISEFADEFFALPAGTIGNDWQKFFEYIYDEDLSILLNKIKYAIENPSTIISADYRIRKANGETAWFTSKGRAIIENNKLTIYGSTIDISDRKLIESELFKAKESAEENESKFSAITNQSSEGITVADIKGNYIYVNPKFCKMSGYSKEELLELTVFDMKAKNQAHQSFYDSKEAMEGLPIRVNLQRKNGTEYLTEIVGKSIKINYQDLILGTIRDITKRVESENALLESEFLLRESQKVALIGSYVLDIYTGQWKSSMTLDNIFGIDNKYQKNIDGWMKLIHPNDEIMMKEYFERNILTDHEFFNQEYRIQKVNDKQERWVQGFGKLEFNKAGELVKMIGTIQDITSRKNTEEHLIRLNTALENSLNEVLIFEAESLNLTYVNQGALKNLAYSMDELMSMTPVDIKPDFDNESFIEKISPLLSNNVSKLHFETVHQRKDKTIYPVDINLSAFTINNKQFILALIIDVTKRKKAEKELIKAKEKAEESDSLKTQFINNLSHEIRTPMNGILGFSNLLNKGNISEEKQRHYINIIQNSGHLLVKIIDDILEISKLGTKQVEVIEEKVCINDLILEQFSVFGPKAKENKISLYIKKNYSDKQSTIFTDGPKLNRILSNLLDNALKFTSEGYIELGYDILTDNDTPQIEIYIKDTGRGINPINHEMIFNPFAQEEKELSKNIGGLGLGLSIAKENVELIGGNISVKSEKEKGSTFFITIPYKEVYNNNEDRNSTINQKESSADKEVYTIVIAEDEEVNYLYLEILLNDLDQEFRIIHAKHGKEVVEICKANSDIDLVLMDLKMPIMTGFKATRIIKEFNPKLPIISQTAYSTSDEKRQALNAGCDDFVSKPISVETLRDVINKFLKFSK